ncbi:hypothetical protein [Pseudoxanthomonas kaohsiungensis]|uniref:Uncharacterized protein n=1 Tax=Pseudoxanthomonas kaohsiungensis TaxID=283923 RepID=A0ABW3LYV7_9GAMM|nr:hypothetical protein [Pseudoxanthomonas kaohsiungensis]
MTNPSPWTDADTDTAAAEGWNLFSTDNTAPKQLEIQREDDLEKFATDVEALTHVYTKAMGGSALHLKALQLSLQTSPAYIPPKVGINFTGGVVQSVFADQDVDLMIIDYEYEYSDDETLVDLPQDNGSVETASVTTHRAHVMPGEYAKYEPAVLAAQEARNAGRPSP